MSIDQIAKYFGVNPTSVSLRLNSIMKYLPSYEDLELMRKSQNDLLDASFLQILSSITQPNKVKKGPINNPAYALSQLHNIIRPQNDKSTENISMIEYFKMVRDTKDNPNPDHNSETSKNKAINLLENKPKVG